ncbi:Mor transcription activator family protein [Methylohalobius crimeensis]|uniref:Mor transcription activator family protein n=1 Tax=Methylohalobius crimeensis TaxID=244365 RepID=UPI0003B79357|nr:Mor transcription activator family protein [Methylohalobius crimeensis]
MTTENTQADAAVELRNILTQAVCQAFDLSETAALSLAERIADNVFTLAGGSELYIPKLDRRHRQAAILAEFNGRNVDELSRRYGISKRQIYRIVNSAIG